MNKIERQYGENSPKPRIKKNLKEYVRVEQKQEKMNDACEFLLYVLRRFTNGFTPSQDRLSEITGIDQGKISKYIKTLEKLGFIAVHKRTKGRSKWCELLKDPIKIYNKIPHSLVLNQDIPWRNRLFAIKLYNQVLENVNEIHLSKSKLAEAMGMTRPTLNSNLAYLENKGIIESIPNGFRIDVYSLLSLTEDVILQQENKIMEQGMEIERLNRENKKLKGKNEELENQKERVILQSQDPKFIYNHVYM